jgi:hypothetical protein
VRSSKVCSVASVSKYHKYQSKKNEEIVIRPYTHLCTFHFTTDTRSYGRGEYTVFPVSPHRLHISLTANGHKHSYASSLPRKKRLKRHRHRSFDNFRQTSVDRMVRTWADKLDQQHLRQSFVSMQRVHV